MRRLLTVLPCLLFATACSSYEGEIYPQVAKTREVRMEQTMPAGYRSIGVASGQASCCETSTFSEPDCSPEHRALRRVRRAAARAGGEALVDVWCHSEVSRDEWYDDEDGWTYEVSVFTDCQAEVARAWSHDANRD
ncbi:MAG: hypothetical protein AAGA54_25460 [Myxococcota bacterium]